MSDATAKKFLDTLDKDKALREEISDGRFQAVKKAAEARGLKFTKEELSRQVKKRFNVKQAGGGSDEADTCHF